MFFFENNSDEIFPEFGEILKILLISNEIFILYNRLQTILYNKSLDVYKIAALNMDHQIMKLVDIDFTLKNYQLSYVFKLEDEKCIINYLFVK